VDGIPEVVGDSGFLVPAGDVLVLAQALRKTYKLSKEELQTIGARSYQRLWENFSIEKYHKAFQEVVER
jgi:glycosyltransferase involved in cell wall biosynthesis